MQKIIKENLAKNIILVILLALLYSPIQIYLLNSNLVNDLPLAGDILVAVSVIAVIACFGNFAFTYEKIHSRSVAQRLLAHFTTGLLMLIIGISLIFASVLVAMIMGQFIIFDIILLGLYVACVGYDFWDLLRIPQN
jgi:hypothetical protein